MSETQDTFEGSELEPYSKLFEKEYSFGSVFTGLLERAVKMPITAVTGDLIFDQSEAFFGTNTFAKYETDSYKTGLSSDLENKFLSFRSSFLGLDHKYRLEIVNKIKNSGLIELIEQIGRNTRVLKVKIFKRRDTKIFCSKNK
jgi:hypothetical protein